MSTNRNRASNTTDAAAKTLRQTGIQPQRQPNTLEVLASRGKKTTAATKNSSGSWEMHLTEQAEFDATRWINAKVLLEPIKSHEEAAKEAFSEYAVRKVAEKIFTNKSKPSNPEVIIRKEDGTEDHRFIFIFQNRFKIALPSHGNGHRDQYVQTFIELGLHPISAASLVDTELDLTPIISVRSPKELMLGRYGADREWIPATEHEKSIGQKLIDLVLWDGGKAPAPAPLTDEERELVIATADSVKVKAGFLDRVADYCQSVDQLMAIFSVIQPIAYPAHQAFAKNDSEEFKLVRKLEACSDIIGKMPASNDE
jgi:uncharacterized membrane protein YkoI